MVYFIPTYSGWGSAGNPYSTPVVAFWHAASDAQFGSVLVMS
jgi:hypothetical protein